MANKKGKYYQRPDGLKESIRTINGKRVAFRGKTDKEVDKKILEYTGEVEKGRMFSAVADEWETECMEKLASGTRTCYTPALNRLRDEFGASRIKEIRPIEISRFITKFAQKGYSQQSVKVQLVVMKLICKHAVIQGDLDGSPCDYVSIPKHLPKARREAATEEQQAAVSESCALMGQGCHRNAEMWLFAYLCMYSGLRRGEALALCYEDVDKEAGKIYVRKKLVWENGKPVVDSFLKTAAGKRDVVLVDKLRNVMPDGTGPIFQSKHGGYITATEFRTGWLNYCKAIGCYHIEEQSTGRYGKNKNPLMQKVYVPDFTPHQLRHVFATYCFDAGVDSKAASKQLGHSKETITRDIYTHISQSREKDTENRLNAFIGGGGRNVANG